MEADQAHAYYVDLKIKGAGAAMKKEGLGFGAAGSGPSPQSRTQFVAQSQSNEHNDAQLAQPALQADQPRALQPAPSGMQHQQARPQFQAGLPHQMGQHPPRPPHMLQGASAQQQMPHIAGPIAPHMRPSPPPPGAAWPPFPNQMMHQPRPLPGPPMHPARGPPDHSMGMQRPQLNMPQPMQARPLGMPPGGRGGGPPGPHMPLGMSPGGRGGPQMPPGGRSGMPLGAPAPGMPPGMRPPSAPGGMPPHGMGPPPGMFPQGMPQGFPPAGSPQAFPGMRPPGGGNLRPPQMAQPGIGGPRPPLPGMQPPMHRPPGSMHRPPGLPPQQQPPRPQHPMQHVAQHSMQQPPVNQQRPAFPPQRPPLMHPPQPQRPMQQPGQVVGPPLQQPMLTPPRPQAAAGSQPHAAQAAHAPPPDIRQGPQQPAASGGTSNGSAPAGWIGHKSSDGQVYYHNTVTAESSWQKPEGFSGQIGTAGGTPVPISSEDIPMTGWAEVTCIDGRKYFYHADRQETSWSKPPEVAAALAKAIKAGSGKRAGMSADQMAIIARLKASNAELDLRPELRDADEQDVNDDVTFSVHDIGRPAGAPVGVPLLPQHPPFMPGGMPRMRPMHFPEAFPPHQAGPAGPGPAAPALPPPRSHADMVEDFKELLLEQGVTPFSRWERELPKLLGDARYKAIDKPKERRQIFDDFCKNVAEEQKRSKQRKEQQQAAAEPAFAALLDEAQAWVEDPQPAVMPPTPPPLPAEDADGIADDEDKEVMEDPPPQPEKGLTAESTPEQMEDAWSEDPRWQACEVHVRERLLLERISLLQSQAAQVSEAQKAAQEQAFRSLLQDLDVTSASRYSRTREALRPDPRYKAMPKAAREPAFKKYVTELQEADEAKAQEAALAAEREAGARRAEAEASKRQQEAAHNDAVAAFQTLLAETVKDPGARWQDWRVKLGKDPQKRADNKAFAPKEQQILFEKYVQGLAVHIEQDYRRLMDQVLKPLLPSQAEGEVRPAALASFQAAQQLMEADPAFDRVQPPDRERLWRRYVQDIVAERDNRRAQRSQAASSRAAERDRGRNARDTGDVVDKAYLREYLEPDQKRIRRD